GRRRVLNVALSLLAELGEQSVGERAHHLYHNADNMTDRMSALNALNNIEGELRDSVMGDFADRWWAYPLVMDKWLRLQASARSNDALDTVKALLDDPRFDFNNSNRIRALLAAFPRGNLPPCHCADGTGYQLLGREIERIAAFNPQMAASLASLLASWQRYVPAQGQPMRAELLRLAEQGVSDNTREILDSALAGPA